LKKKEGRKKGDVAGIARKWSYGPFEKKEKKKGKGGGGGTKQQFDITLPWSTQCS